MGFDHILMIDYRPRALVFVRAVVTLLAICYVAGVEKEKYCLLEHTASIELSKICTQSGLAFLLLFFIPINSSHFAEQYARLRILWRLRGDPNPATQSNLEKATREKKQLVTDFYSTVITIVDVLIAAYVPGYLVNSGGGVPDQYYIILSLQGLKFVISVLYLILFEASFH